MVINYQWWLVEHQQHTGVLTLREFISQEAEYRAIAAEAVHGVVHGGTAFAGVHMGGHFHQRAHFTNAGAQKEQLSVRCCPVCSNPYGPWACPQFRSATVEQRWELAKMNKLCFKCLGVGDSG